MRDVVIVAAKRSAIGSFGGMYKDISSRELGKQVVVNLLNSVNVDASNVDEVIVGSVLPYGSGQNIARQISIDSGIPETVPAFTINKVCGSGMKAIQLAAHSIMVGENEIVVAGGVENMSQSPYLLFGQRFGSKMGNTTLVDAMITDGLWDAFEDIHMGITAENVGDLYKITREEMDTYALLSQNRAQRAIEQGRFNDEIAPIETTDKRTKALCHLTQDEHPRFNATLDKLSTVRPAFKKDGNVSAANASGINDGAAFVLLTSHDYAIANNLEILGVLESFGTAGVDPSIMGTGPIPAVNKALKNANLSINDIELFEVNEAFASQVLAFTKAFNLNTDIVNVNGGGIALGHPIGASGARIIVSLVHEMQKQSAQYGLATLCIGGGMGIATVIRKEK